MNDAIAEETGSVSRVVIGCIAQVDIGAAEYIDIFRLYVALRDVRGKLLIEFLEVRDVLKERAEQSQLVIRPFWGYTYYKPTRYESVEMDAASNAGHVVDPAKEMQFCPYVPVIKAAAAAIKAVLLMSRVHVLGVGPCDVPRIVLARMFMLRSCLFQNFRLMLCVNCTLYTC